MTQVHLWLTVEPPTRSNGGYGHVILTPCYLEGDKPRLFSSRNYGEGSDAALADLQIRCQIDGHPGETQSYAWEVEYRPLSVDLAQAEAYAKQLRRIGKGLERIREEHGSPLSFGQFVARVALLLKVKATFERTTPAGYEARWKQHELAYVIDARVRELRDAALKLEGRAA